MCPACLRGTMTAGPDVIRGSGPNHSHGLDAHDPEAGCPDRRLDRFASRHHHPRNSIVAPPSPQAPHCQASSGGCSKRRRSIGLSFGHDRPGDARHLVGHRDGDDLGWFLGQQPA